MKTFFVYAPFVLAVLTFLTFVLRCGFKVRGQALWMMALLACAAKFLIFQEMGGDAFVPELPAGFIWGYSVLYTALFLLFGFSILTFFFKFRYKALLLPVVALVLAGWGVYNGVCPPQVEEVTLTFPQLPSALEGYRIVQVSDTHISSSLRRARTEKVVELANSLNADLLVMTGDIVDGAPRLRRRDVQPLKDLRAKDGVYFITGNHEYYYHWYEWKPIYDQWGLKFLQNKAVPIRDGLVLGGVDDPAVHLLHTSVNVSPRHLFDAYTNGEFRVLLQHRPLVNHENNVADGVCDLQLSGHTHGGIAPGLDRIVGSFFDGFVRGAYHLAKGWLYVCPGAGEWAGFPERYFNPSVISVLTLRKQ